MKRLMACILLLAAGATGQARNENSELVSQLMKMRDAGGDANQRIELTSAIIALAEPGHEPSRFAVAALVRELTKALEGRSLSSVAANQIALSITDVLRSSGTGTAAFRQSIANFRATLSAMGAGSPYVQTAAARLTEVGNEVRGPEDMPRLPPR